MDKTISNTKKYSNPQIDSDNNSDINKKRITLIMLVILLCLGYYIYMIWEHL
jgi:hypothetical protein